MAGIAEFGLIELAIFFGLLSISVFSYCYYYFLVSSTLALSTYCFGYLLAYLLMSYSRFHYNSRS